MRCVWCNIDASFRYCSNACFLAWAKTRIGVKCAICQYDPATGRIGNHQTSRRCDDCKAGDENVDWCEEKIDTDSSEQIDEVVVTQRLPDLIDKPIKNERPIVREALAMLFQKLPYRVIADRLGKSFPWVCYIYRTRVEERPKRSNWSHVNGRHGKKGSPTGKRRKGR